MKKLRSKIIPRSLIVTICTVLLTALPTAAQAGKPFRLPVTAPAGPSTWLLGQAYGNTIGAYLRGDDWYSAGQRLHFGMDFSMPCGTPLAAIADGTVMFVDDMGFGSAPHNLLIRHDNAGLVSLYGHLLERAPVSPGQFVTAGEVVGYSGTPDATCDSRPHLHLEIRSLDYQTTYNPVDTIEANWDMLTSIGSFSSQIFMQDLDNARRWMTLYDQPAVVFGGRALNNYANPYPDLRNGGPVSNPPLGRTLDPLPADQLWSAAPLTYGGCCANAWWSPSSPSSLLMIDGAENQRASIFLWDTDSRELLNNIGQAPPPITSADGTFVLRREGDGMRIQRVSDLAEWFVPTQNEWATLNADNSQLLWTVTTPTAAGSDQPPATTLWISNFDGSDARAVGQFPQASAQWLDTTRLLVGWNADELRILSVFDTMTGSSFDLGGWDRLRGISVAPGGGRIMFYLTHQPDPTADGVYMVETTAGAQPVKLDWFGGWRWRDENSVYYLPFDSTQANHSVRYYDFSTGEDQLIMDGASVPIRIANGDWSVSPDGDQIALWNALDQVIWILQPAITR